MVEILKPTNISTSFSQIKRDKRIALMPFLMAGDPDLENDLLKGGVAIRAVKEESPSLLMQIFISWFPLLLLIGVWIFFMRQMQGGAGGRGGPMSFGKSKAKLLGEDQLTTPFADVAEEAATSLAGDPAAAFPQTMA